MKQAEISGPCLRTEETNNKNWRRKKEEEKDNKNTPQQISRMHIHHHQHTHSDTHAYTHTHARAHTHTRVHTQNITFFLDKSHKVSAAHAHQALSLWGDPDCGSAHLWTVHQQVEGADQTVSWPVGQRFRLLTAGFMRGLRHRGRCLGSCASVLALGPCLVTVVMAEPDVSKVGPVLWWQRQHSFEDTVGIQINGPAWGQQRQSSRAVWKLRWLSWAPCL